MFDQTLLYVWTGRATMELPQGKIRLKPGMCLWLRPGFEYRHRQDPDRPLGTYSVHFDLLTPDGHPRPATKPMPPELLSPPNAKYVERVITRLVGANPEEFIWSSAMTAAARKQATCLLTALLMELDATAVAKSPIRTRREPPHIAHINEIYRRILEDPSQFQSVADMARELHYTQSHFSRLFKKICRMSPQHALVMSRLRHAARMLLETDMPIKAIAERLGYCDMCFFTRQFRRIIRISPSRYRRRKRQKRSLTAWSVTGAATLE